MKPIPAFPARGLSRPCRAAFSLIELMAVIAIAIILMALVIPNLSSVNPARQLSEQAGVLQSDLSMARRLAISRNMPVEMRFYRTDSTDTPALKDSYVAYQILAQRGDDIGGPTAGKFVPETPIRALPGRVMVHKNPTYTTLAKPDRVQPADPDAQDSGNSRAAGLPYFAVRFLPNGSTQLGKKAAEPWSITLQLWTPADETTLANNFITLVVDPFNGKISRYQPGA